MELYSGNYKVIDTGSVITFDEDSGIEMVIRPNKTFSFRVFIEFEENGGEREVEKTVSEKDNEIHIKCINWELGAGTVNPFDLATAGGKKVYLHLWVGKIAASRFIRKVEYTAFIER